MLRYGWMDSALCNGVDPEVFFPDGVNETHTLARAKAKAICSWCPVRETCLEFAISMPWVQYGVWAGLDATEVRRLARRRAGEGSVWGSGVDIW